MVAMEFQSRNRESYLFKSRAISIERPCAPKGFNLVIENLIFSSQQELIEGNHPHETFQSRNRESYLFKFDENAYPFADVAMFQSRNRESYLFKFGNVYRHRDAQPVSIS